MPLDDELVRDYQALIRDLSEELIISRRPSKNFAILDYVRQLHEILYSRKIDFHDEMEDSHIAKSYVQVGIAVAPSLA